MTRPNNNSGDKRSLKLRDSSARFGRKHGFARKSLHFDPQGSFDSPEMLLVGTVADLLEEIKNLALGISRNKRNKNESIKLFQSLLAHYHPLIGTSYRDVICLFIYDTCKDHRVHDVDPKEIVSWWPK